MDGHGDAVAAWLVEFAQRLDAANVCGPGRDAENRSSRWCPEAPGTPSRSAPRVDRFREFEA